MFTSQLRNRVGSPTWGSKALSQDLPVILVIEDDHAIQIVVEDALSEGGFEPAIAASGEEAVTLLRGMKNTYRALVTDISLRGKIDGWKVAQQAREIDPCVYRKLKLGRSCGEVRQGWRVI
jgi:CheY-like chemotaxis protein